MRPAAAAAPVTTSGARPFILVAEDEDSLRGMLTIVLRSHGYDALLCAHGADARAAIQSDQRIDLALFDLRMPLVTGSELIAAMRSDPRRAGTPVIAMSAYNDEIQARALLAAGADAFLAKPFTLRELTSTIATLLHRA